MCTGCERQLTQTELADVQRQQLAATTTTTEKDDDDRTGERVLISSTVVGGVGIALNDMRLRMSPYDATDEHKQRDTTESKLEEVRLISSKAGGISLLHSRPVQDTEEEDEDDDLPELEYAYAPARDHSNTEENKEEPMAGVIPEFGQPIDDFPMLPREQPNRRTWAFSNVSVYTEEDQFLAWRHRPLGASELGSILGLAQDSPALGYFDEEDTSLAYDRTQHMNRVLGRIHGFHATHTPPPPPPPVHDHLGPLCFRPELHEESLLSETLKDADNSDGDVALLRLFRQTLDASAPHCPVCRRLGLKSGSECNVISCRCGTEWCFMCSKQLFSSARDYIHARQTRPDRTAFMLVRGGTGELVPITTENEHYLSSTNHHGCFATVSDPSYRHDPSDPGKVNTLCPSTLEQLATTYQLPDFVSVRDDYYNNRHVVAVPYGSGSGSSKTQGNPEDVVQDGLELRLLPAFLRLCAVRALRTLQTKLAPHVFLRGLRLLPDWSRDAHLCEQLGVPATPDDHPPRQPEPPPPRTTCKGIPRVTHPHEAGAGDWGWTPGNANVTLHDIFRQAQLPFTRIQDQHLAIARRRMMNNMLGFSRSSQQNISLGASPLIGFSNRLPSVIHPMSATAKSLMQKVRKTVTATSSMQQVRNTVASSTSATSSMQQLHKAMFGESDERATRKSLHRKKPAGGRR